jgi:hypothetical protein
MLKRLLALLRWFGPGRSVQELVATEERAVEARFLRDNAELYRNGGSPFYARNDNKEID